MCMFCAAVPVAAATGLSMDAKKTKTIRAQGRIPPRLRLYLILTVAVIFLLMLGSVIVHSRPFSYILY